MVLFPSILPGNFNNENKGSDASESAFQEDEYSTTLFTVKDENNRVPFNLLLTYSKDKKMVKVLSILRDTYAPILDKNDGTTSYDKLTFAYVDGLGGVENVETTVSKLFDLTIDYYAVMELEIFSTALLLMACSGDAEQNTIDDKIKGHQATEDQDNSEGNNDFNEEKDDSNVEKNASSTLSKSEDNDVLSQYAVKEIEYARVWLQLGANQELDELHVEHISKGTPLNHDDETSIDYPEDIIQLSGTRLVDGVITYSGNGDGTINVYNVPKRWDGKNPAGEDVYKKIIEEIEREAIDTGDDEKVEELIKILNINS